MINDKWSVGYTKLEILISQSKSEAWEYIDLCNLKRTVYGFWWASWVESPMDSSELAARTSFLIEGRYQLGKQTRAPSSPGSSVASSLRNCPCLAPTSELMRRCYRWPVQEALAARGKGTRCEDSPETSRRRRISSAPICPFFPRRRLLSRRRRLLAPPVASL
jgi:hypothetical protein